jgi:hypothetical protein
VRTIKFCIALAMSVAMVAAALSLGVLLMGEVAQFVHYLIKG